MVVAVEVLVFGQPLDIAVEIAECADEGAHVRHASRVGEVAHHEAIAGDGCLAVEHRRGAREAEGAGDDRPQLRAARGGQSPALQSSRISDTSSPVCEAQDGLAVILVRPSE